MYIKQAMVTLMTVAIVASSFPVQAGTFGKSASVKSATPRSSTFSSSRSSTSPTSSTFSNSSSGTSTTGGISQGSSIGMSRSNVANGVKNGSYSAPANGTTVAGSNPGGSSNVGGATGGYSNGNSGNYGNNGSYNNGYGNQGHSTGTVLGAAAVAGAAGYMMGNHNSGYNNGGYNNGNGYNNGGQIMDGNGNYGNNGYNNGGPVIVSSGFGAGDMIWSLIKIIVGLVVLFIIVRVIMTLFGNRGSDYVTAPIASFNKKTPEDEIRDMKEQFFVNFQKNNRPSGLDQIRSNSTPLFFDAISDMVNGQSESRVVKVHKIDSELVDITKEGSRYIASVRYNATVEEGDGGTVQTTEVKELWNFVYENSSWKLAGIDQL